MHSEPTETCVGQLPEDVIRRELSPTEQLLWAGRPRQGFVLRAADSLIIPFSIMWGGFAIFWEANAIAMGAGWFFALWGIPFVVIGLYLMVGRFWVDARQRAATTYGVTSERIIIISGLLSRNVKSLNIDALPDVSLSERSDGGGVITFLTAPYLHSWFVNAQWPGMGQHIVPNFELAERARDVYEIIRNAQRQSRHRRSDESLAR
ncbi:MAG TPA: hypothetical protein VGK58_12520 [Lacipirellulaceae bacterium]